MAFEQILFPVDFSEHCTALADYAAAISRGSKAKLTLLNVLEYPPPWASGLETAHLMSLVDLTLMKEHRQEQLNQYLKQPLHDLAPLRLFSQGDAATEIVKFATKEAVNLIMMPTRGCGLFRRLLLGSVTAKVLHDSPCPVWTNSHSEHIVPARYPLHTVACAVDLSERSAETISWASRFASEQKADMHVVHAIDENEESNNRGVLKVRRYLSERARARWHDLERELGLKVPLFLAYGSPGTGVRKATHDLEADVVIIGRGHLQQPLGGFRTNCYAIVRESPCPVISV